MPVQKCQSAGKPGYKWGKAGKCYTYEPGNTAQRKEAKRRAYIQGYAIEGGVLTDSERVTMAKLFEVDTVQLNGILDRLRWPKIRDRFHEINEKVAERVWRTTKTDYLAGMEGTARGMKFVVPDLPAERYAQEYFKRRGMELVTTLDATDLKMYKELMAKPEIWKMTPTEFHEYVKDYWPNSPARARLIFQNEKHEALIAGQQDFIEKEVRPRLTADQELLVTWHHSHQSRVPRPHHIAVDGETVTAGKSFSSGVTVPGGIGCKCTLEYNVVNKNE